MLEIQIHRDGGLPDRVDPRKCWCVAVRRGFDHRLAAARKSLHFTVVHAPRRSGWVAWQLQRSERGRVWTDLCLAKGVSGSYKFSNGISNFAIK